MVISLIPRSRFPLWRQTRSSLSGGRRPTPRHGHRSRNDYGQSGLRGLLACAKLRRVGIDAHLGYAGSLLASGSFMVGTSIYYDNLDNLADVMGDGELFNLNFTVNASAAEIILFPLRFSKMTRELQQLDEQIVSGHVHCRRIKVNATATARRPSSAPT